MYEKVVNVAQAGAAMEVISDEILSSNSSGGYTLSSIPNTYAGLVLEVQGRSTRGVTVTGIGVRFNGDTGNNYDYQYYRVNNTTVSGGIANATSLMYLGVVTAASASANYAGMITLRIPNYASTTFYKTVTGLAYAMGGGTTNDFLQTASGQWRSTSAVTSITLQDDAFGSNWLAGTRFTLYGVGSQ